MSNHNSVSAVGRLGRDFELRYTTSGTPVAKSSIAISSGYGDRQRTDWVSVETWGQTAEYAAEKFKKGSLVAIMGRIQTDEWKTREGEKRLTTKVVFDSIAPVFTKKKDEKKTGGSPQSEQPASVPADDDMPF